MVIVIDVGLSLNARHIAKMTYTSYSQCDVWRSCPTGSCVQVNEWTVWFQVCRDNEYSEDGDILGRGESETRCTLVQLYTRHIHKVMWHDILGKLRGTSYSETYGNFRPSALNSCTGRHLKSCHRQSNHLFAFSFPLSSPSSSSNSSSTMARHS